MKVAFPLDTYANILDYYYTNRRTKSPDASFVPTTLTIPPALPQPNSISARKPQGVPFPTIVIECAYQNESWPRLLRDARTKTFAITTSIQVWIGCKIYKSSRTFRCIWAKRRLVGHNMKVMKTTRQISLDSPTRVQLNIPAHLIFWGTVVPPHLQGTDCIFKLELIRECARDLVV
jgi:hypothetical protein